MKLIYTFEEFDESAPSIFLAGPTPRSNEIMSWRPEAIELFSEIGFGGGLLIPEYNPESPPDLDRNSWDKQVEWEWDALDCASAIMFWIPRNMTTLPGLTTNIELIYLALRPNKCVIGFPDEAVHCEYIRKLANRFNTSCYMTIRQTVKKALQIAQS